MSMFRLGDAAKAVAGWPEAVLLFALLVKMGCRLFGRALPWTNQQVVSLKIGSTSMDLKSY